MRRAFAFGDDEWRDDSERERERQERNRVRRQRRATEQAALDAAHDHLDVLGLCACWAVRARTCPHTDKKEGQNGC